MARFNNPNHPMQPQKGVYGWFASKGKTRFTVYIGKSNDSTLLRGVCQLVCSPLTSNPARCKHSTLDTNFIVGTAIIFLEKNGYSCTWKHLSKEPVDEKAFVREVFATTSRECNGKNKK